MTCITNVATKQYNGGGFFPPPINENDNIFDLAEYSCKSKNKESRARVRINKLHWEQIPRANNPQKVLQEKAINLLSVIEYKLRKNDLVLLNHKYLSTITKCKKDQNVNLLKQLDHIFDIKFHAKLVVGTKIYRNCYAFKNTEKGRSIIENSSAVLTKKESSLQSASSPVENTPTEDKKEQPCAEFFPSSSIYKKEESKNRSIKSNFNDKKNSKKERPGNKPKTLVKFGKPQKLADFYPLKKKDVEELQYKSGREFNKQAMNEILKDMGKKLTKPEFWSRKGFIAYMSEAFKYEKRDAVKINNETFQIRANETKEEQQERIEEEYLTKLENNLQVSPEWHFKKKLASVLERSKAYNLLISLTAVTLEKKGKVRLKLSKNVELSPTDKKIILQQAKATHEKYENGEYIGVNSIELQVKQNNQYKQNNKKEEKKQHQQMPKTLWGRVRQRLQKIYGEDLDRSWFSNLQTEENKEKKEIKIIYPSGFYQDWIERNYLETMKQIAKEQRSVILSISETTA